MAEIQYLSCRKLFVDVSIIMFVDARWLAELGVLVVD